MMDLKSNHLLIKTEEKKSRPQNRQFYFKEGITYTYSGSKGPSFRLLPRNCIFDVSGSSIFGAQYKKTSYLLGFLNSKLSFYILKCLNPTVSTQAGDINRVPFSFPSSRNEKLVELLVDRNIEITNRILSYSICEPKFNRSPLNSDGADFFSSIRDYFNFENHLNTQILINSTIVDKVILSDFDLTESEIEMVINQEGEHIGGLPVSVGARDAYLAEENAIKEFPINHVSDFINTLPIKQFTPVDQETIEREFPYLYKGKNDLEEICIRHQINPINVWYWFKQSNVLPQQRMHILGMEILADMLREILMEDEDGIIPLVLNSGEKILIERLEDKFREKGFSMAQYSSFNSVLGRPLNEYLDNYFFDEFSGHLKLFKRLPATPFIWHLTSGPEQGFDCYIIIYKWSRDKLMRIRSVYIENRERALVNRQSDLAGNESAEAQNEKDKIYKQLREIEEFKVKIDELLAEGYDPILDDGVGKNIAPLQKKKMIPYDVLTAGQLKKYFNADW